MVYGYVFVERASCAIVILFEDNSYSNHVMLAIFLRQGEEVPMENLSLYSSGQQRGYAPNHMVSEI